MTLKPHIVFRAGEYRWIRGGWMVRANSVRELAAWRQGDEIRDVMAVPTSSEERRAIARTAYPPH